MQELHSTAIKRIYYSARRRELYVAFHSGRVYMYLNVSQEEYDRFLGAPSLGEYFNLHVRDHYRFRELKPEPARFSPRHSAA